MNRNIVRSKVYNATVRARALGAPGTFTVEEWIELCERYGGRCLCCGRIPSGIGSDRLCVDHVIAMSQGGSNTIDNIQPLCNYCNNSKHDLPKDYRPERFHDLALAAE